jgi:hypothetical protein
MVINIIYTERGASKVLTSGKGKMPENEEEKKRLSRVFVEARNHHRSPKEREREKRKKKGGGYP